MNANNNGNNGHNMGMDHGSGLGSTEASFVEEHRRVLGWVAELLNGNSRETALMELSKKREQVPELALLIWHSFGESGTARRKTLLILFDRGYDFITSRNHFSLSLA